MDRPKKDYKKYIVPGVVGAAGLGAAIYKRKNLANLGARFGKMLSGEAHNEMIAKRLKTLTDLAKEHGVEPKDLTKLYVEESIKNMAKAKSLKSQIGEGVGNWAGAGVMTLGGAGIGAVIEKTWGERKKKNAFKKMMEANPALKRDPVEAMNYFSALWDLNKEIASSPIVSGAFIRQHMDMQLGIPASSAIDLIKARSESQKAKASGRGFKK